MITIFPSAFLACTFGCISDVKDDKLISSTDITLTRVVPVADYYIYNGNYILENHITGNTKDIKNLEVKDVTSTSKIYLEERTKHYKASFWHSSKNVKDTFMVFKGE